MEIIIKRIYHPYHKWEDYKNGMWRTLGNEDEDEWIQKTIDFTANTSLFGKWMMEVVKAWPVACEHNLTDTSSNRRAWIGQAAACLSIKSPEYITRLSWWQLTEKQRNDANKQADYAINQWQSDYMDKVNNLQQTKLF